MRDDDDHDPYAQTALYDLEYAEYDEDLEHYLALARRRRGPILELGCGSGRITLPVARSGIAIDGIDASSAMLAELGRRLREEPPDVRNRVRTWLGDFRALDPTLHDSLRYPLVLWPFNALHHCASAHEIAQVLAGVRRVLAPGGTFGLDCYLPDPELYERDPQGRYEMRTFVDPRDGTDMVSWEEGWFDHETRVHHVIYVYVRQDGRDQEERIHLRLHMYEQDELLALFEDAGFYVHHAASDFIAGDLRPDSLKLVALLKPR